MQIANKVAVVTGGASGLGQATAEALAGAGAVVAIFDLNDELGQQTASKLGPNALYCRVNVTSEDDVKTAVSQVMAKLGAIHICINCAGVGGAVKTVSRGEPFPLEQFTKIVNINLIGSFNVLRLAAVEMGKNAPEGPSGERGVIINTASIAAYDGQMGQAAYAASKGGVVSMALPIARDLARDGIRCMTIAPGLFETPMVKGLSDKIRAGIEAQLEYPKRFGLPSEYAKLATQIIENSYLNGECIRLDAASRLPPR
ncbi:MAG: SDR family NAD(P)-dependent oxidoreductase [Gammaproteobacteria bacterium]|nr:SDR family NAD(P)-dependent oxidoreductase [Gammaproteobacteria bacterium]